MTASYISVNPIFDLFTGPDNPSTPLSTEFIEDQFSHLLTMVSNKIRDLDVDSVIDFINELLLREVQLKDHQYDLFIINNYDFSKLLLYEVNYLHGRIINLLVEYLTNAHAVYYKFSHSDSSLASQFRASIIGMAGQILNYLITVRSYNETDIDLYIHLLTETINLFNA